MRSLSLKSGALAVLMTVALGIEAPTTTHAEEAPRTQRLLESGPYGVGKVDITVPNVSNPQAPRFLKTTVWYPAKDDAAKELPDAVPGKAKDGFPLIVYGHGLGSVQTDVTHVASHLATHGYVVASILFPKSNAGAQPAPSAGDVDNQVVDMLFTSGYLVSPTAQQQLAFAKTIDSTRIGLMGYSLGGLTAAYAATAAPAVNPNIKAIATFAPAACGGFLAPKKPSVSLPLLVINGDTDAITPADINGDQLFTKSFEGPKYLVHLSAGSHAGFIFGAEQTLQPAASPYANMDGLICMKLAGSVSPIEQQACQVCTGNTRIPQLGVLRHQAIQKAAVLSFFDGYLRDERRDQQYLKTGLENENPEVDVTYVGAANQ